MKFVAIRTAPGAMASGIYAIAAPLGTAVGAGSDVTLFALAGATNFVGHLTRQVTVAGPTLLDHLVGPTDANGLELPLENVVKGGLMSSARKLLELEVEGTDYLVQSGTGAVTTSAAVGAQLGFIAGKLRLVQTNDQAVYAIRSQETPEDVGNTRVRLVAI